jgi:hypothetical protein
MLANILAIVVGASSLYLLSTAFSAADRHRKDDFLWGAVGLFYALVLWLCAGRFTGAILLGQAAASVLLLVFGWQTLQLRQALLYPDRPVQLFSAVEWLQGRLGKVSPLKPPKTPVSKSKESPIEKISEKVKETIAPVAEKVSSTVTEVPPEPTIAEEEDIDDIFDDFDEDNLDIDENVTEPGKVILVEEEALQPQPPLTGAEPIDDIFDDFDADSPEVDENATEAGKAISEATVEIVEVVTTEITATLEENATETEIPTENFPHQN